jgi:RNA polymerase sigma factor (sigma-70 family)
VAGVHRAAVSPDGTVAGPPGDSYAGRQAVEAVWRIESARIVGALARYTGDFAMAEDLAQEALAEALVSWPRDGVPHSPSGWLLTVGRRRAIDAFRRRSALDERYTALASDLQAGETTSGSAPIRGEEDDVLYDPERIDDDVLALIFISCHPVLSREASVALTLRVLGGLTSDEIARAFVTPSATVQARITRAKKTLAAAHVPFGLPSAVERRERLSSVLSVVYLIFTEGSSATSGSEWIRTDLAREAIRLARVLARLVPDEPETHGLLGSRSHPTWPGRARHSRTDRARTRRLRPPSLHCRMPCHRAVGRGDGLGAHRPAVRRPGLPRALAHRRPQPSRRRLDGERSGGSPAARRFAGRDGRAFRITSAARRTR